MTVDGVEGTYFAVWAPNAEQVSVMGDFNGWNRSSHPLTHEGNRVSGKDLSPVWLRAQSTNIPYFPSPWLSGGESRPIRFL